MDPPLAEDENRSTDPANPINHPANPELDDAGEAAGEYPTLDSPRPGHTGTRTRTSASTGERADPKLTGELAAAALGMLFAAGAFVLQWRSRTGRARRLREPTDEQLADMAAPLAAIGARHLPAAVLNNDLADGLRFGAQVGNYLRSGPLFIDRVDPGVPANLQEEEQLQ